MFAHDAWAAPPADEAEDDEVQGIFASPVPGQQQHHAQSGHQQQQQQQQQPLSGQLLQHMQQQGAGAGQTPHDGQFDDMMRQLNGIIGGADDYSHPHEAAVTSAAPAFGSQLNANVPEFQPTRFAPPPQQQQQQQPFAPYYEAYQQHPQQHLHAPPPDAVWAPQQQALPPAGHMRRTPGPRPVLQQQQQPQQQVPNPFGFSAPALPFAAMRDSPAYMPYSGGDYPSEYMNEDTDFLPASVFADAAQGPYAPLPPDAAQPQFQFQQPGSFWYEQLPLPQHEQHQHQHEQHQPQHQQRADDGAVQALGPALHASLHFAEDAAAAGSRAGVGTPPGYASSSAPQQQQQQRSAFRSAPEPRKPPAAGAGGSSSGPPPHGGYAAALTGGGGRDNAQSAQQSNGHATASPPRPPPAPTQHAHVLLSQALPQPLTPDEVSRKRADLDDTPQSRGAFKDFLKAFRARERAGYAEAMTLAQQTLRSQRTPARAHWRVLLEMADLAKRENRFREARELFARAVRSQPLAHQGWLEFAKMEEECGRRDSCRAILLRGLDVCGPTEQLLTKAIKHEERMGNLHGARRLLARLRTQSVDKAWRTVLEGALLEARAGSTAVARGAFKYLMRHVTWYGPIFYEASRFEERCEDWERAVAVVEQGLEAIPRYGPLWFNAVRLYEKLETDAALRSEAGGANVGDAAYRVLRTPELAARHDLQRMFGVPPRLFAARGAPPPTGPARPLPRTRAVIRRALGCISRELQWKVHFEAAQTEERAGGADALQRVRAALVQSVLLCPLNLRWKAWLAGARAELTAGNEGTARSLLARAQADVPPKSRAQVSLECARLEEFAGRPAAARAILRRARRDDGGEWKVFLESVLLELRDGRRDAAIRVAESALAAHAGTGRLWAVLVQLKHAIGPDSQRLVFREALKSCPKSGEVWCEGARRHMNPLSPYFDLGTAFRYLDFAVQFTPQYGGSFLELLRWRLLRANFGAAAEAPAFAHVDDAGEFRQRMDACDVSDVELCCVNADPNYGALWFHCRRSAFDTARQVLRAARRVMTEELVTFRRLYREAVVDAARRQAELAARRGTREGARTTPALAGAEDRWLLDRLRVVPGVRAEDCNFSTGLLSVNWLAEHAALLSDAERFKLLFGADTLVP